MEAETAGNLPGALGTPGPFGAGVGVVLAEADDIAPLEPGAGGLLLEPGLGRQHAARKHVLLDEIGALAVVGEQLVADGDDLQSGAAARGQHVANLAEV